MIDKTKKFWTGDGPDDIDQYLRLYAGEEELEVRPVVCRGCGGEVFRLRSDRAQGAVQVICPECGAKRLLLDSGEIWKDARPRRWKCSVCKASDSCHVRVGLSRRESGSVRWVYIGVRCAGCGTLGSPLDWRIDYEPTDEMEKEL